MKIIKTTTLDISSSEVKRIIMEHCKNNGYNVQDISNVCMDYNRSTNELACKVICEHKITNENI